MTSTHRRTRCWWTASCTCGWWAGQWWITYAKAEKARKAHQQEHPPWTAKSWNTVPRPPLVTTPTCDADERPTARPKR